VHTSPFEELATRDHLLELLKPYKEILAAIHLILTWRTSSERHRIAKIRYNFQYAPDERAFAAARRRADDE
jgi:hypothetical protein